MRCIKAIMVLSLTVMGFYAGYFYGKALPEIITIKRDRVFQEVRDSYNRRCVSEGIVDFKGQRMEEQWSCPKMKVFLIKRFAQLEYDRPSLKKNSANQGLQD